MPVLLALICGAHTDSRYRRNIGGTLTPEYDRITSNIPFLALAQVGGWEDLISELKPINALLAVSIVSLYVVRRGRIPSSVKAAVK